MKNSYAQALSAFAWILMIAGTIAGIIMISHSTDGYGVESHPFVIPGIGLIFASIFGGILYLTIAKISSDLSENLAGNRKIALYPIWYQKWGSEIANAVFEGKLLKGMTKEQVIGSIGNPLSSEESGTIEILHYYYSDTQGSIKNLIIDNGVIICWMNSLKALKPGFGLKLGMTQEDVEKEIGDPDKVEEKKIKEHGSKQKFTIYYYYSVLRSKESETTSLKLYFDESGTLVREES